MLAGATALSGLASGAHAQLVVTSASPAPRSLGASITSSIVIDFDRPVKPATLVPMQSFWAFGRWSGSVDGTIQLSNGDQTATLVPARPFLAGESVMVFLSREIEAVDLSLLPVGGYSYQFWTATQTRPAELAIYDTKTTRTTPEVHATTYGGTAVDLNGDGYPDISSVNEGTEDVRVFMNRAKGTAEFDDFSLPTYAAGPGASPSEPSDFNRDGDADLVVSNAAGNTVSVFLGNGDGTFAAPQNLVIGGPGNSPRGLGVLDADGDGDVDIVTANRWSNDISLLLNNGDGTFAPHTAFESGVDGEYALGVADFDEDGILDLVVGGQVSETLSVMGGNGDGTFTSLGTQPAACEPWQLTVGDVDGDSHVDVATAGGLTDLSVVLLGDGLGGLGTGQTYATPSWALSSDLGDLDGDGDLDWVTSSYSGEWRVFENDGQGVFSPLTSFIAGGSAACAVMMDSDKDGDLDMAMFDEGYDVVVFVRNGTSPGPAPVLSGVFSTLFALVLAHLGLKRLRAGRA